MILVIVDTTGIQPYIFGSNRLQENIGASYLVKQATTHWAQNAADQTGGTLVYAGGGNFLATFEDSSGSPTPAQQFIRQLSREVLQKAPGLQLVIAEQKYASEAELPAAVRTGFVLLARKKRCRSLSAPLLGLSVTRMCQSTGLPAVEMVSETIDGPPRLAVSSEIAAKTGQVNRTNRELQSLFHGVMEGTSYQFPRDFDHLGRSLGEHSFMAVVHADGNGLGEHIQEIGKESRESEEEYRTRIQAFSKAVNEAGQQALCETLGVLITRLQHDSPYFAPRGEGVCLWAGGRISTNVELKKSQNGHYLPYRPLVFGGDDVTFVCDGRLALSLATTYLQKFEAKARALPYAKGPITACAGVAIIPAHYPFARAYQMAESLCHSAKTYRNHKGLSGSCLDWHFAQSGLSESLEKLRRREYEVAQGALHQRPVTLEANPVADDELHAWPLVRAATQEFQQGWANKRNKLKTLREELREGGPTVQRFLTRTGIDELPKLSHPSQQDLSQTGWLNRQCAYFDAVELADWFIDLKEVQNDAPHGQPNHESEVPHVSGAATASATSQ